MIEQTAKILKALGEPTRLRIIKFLYQRELCICELVAILDMSQPRISQHVKVLKEAGLINERKVRQNTYVSINPTVLEGTTIVPFISYIATDIERISDLQNDFQRFMNLDYNEEVICCKNGQRVPLLNLSKIV